MSGAWSRTRRRVRAALRAVSDRERILAVLAAAFALTGAGMTLFAWRGASRTIVLAEQLPYLISGGLLGLALMFTGGLCYAVHVQARGIRQRRAQEVQIERRHRAVLLALDEESARTSPS